MRNYKRFLFTVICFGALGAGTSATYAAAPCAPPGGFQKLGAPPPGDLPPPVDGEGFGPPRGCNTREEHEVKKLSSEKAARADRILATGQPLNRAAVKTSRPQAGAGAEPTLKDLQREAREALADLLSREINKIEDKRCPADGEPRFSNLPRWEDEVMLQVSAPADLEAALKKFVKSEARAAREEAEEAKREKTEECEKKQARAAARIRADKAAETRPAGLPGMPAGNAPNGDCIQCNAMRNGGSPNQSKSSLESIAEVIRAATPIGLGAMSLGGNIYGMNKQSSDYRYYNDNNTSLGLPSSAPSSYSGYMNSLNSSMNSLMSMSLFSGGYGMNSYGMGMSGYGMGESGLFGGYSGGMGMGMGMNFGYPTSTYGFPMMGMGGYGMSSGLFGLR